jgi:hypothetical protein
MNEQYDILVELRFINAQEFSAQLILGTIEAVERAIAQTEREEIDALAEEFSSLPPAVFDAMRYRARQLPGRSLNLRAATSGSLVLAGAVVALSYWLLDKTVGETVKEAWEHTSLHSKVRDFLLSRTREKADLIASRVRPSRWRECAAEFAVKVEQNDRSIVIVVVVAPGQELAALPRASDVDRAR